MYKIIRMGVVSLYVLLTGFCFLLTLGISGIYISWLTFFAAMAGWVLFCLFAVHIRGPIALFFHGRLRKPIMEEEVKMQGCFVEVLKSAGCLRKFRLLIVEVTEVEAFVCSNNVIAISRELLNKLSDNELKGVLAHELGHLMDKDTMLSWAFVTAGDLPSVVRRMCLLASRVLWRLLGMLLVVVLFVLFLFGSRFVLPVLGIVLFLFLFWVLGGLFRWMQLVLSRHCEYRQDEYAYRLGFGAGLRDALKKIAQYGKEDVNAYFILMNGTHPVIYDRIRRLEQLLGLRI